MSGKLDSIMVPEVEAVILQLADVCRANFVRNLSLFGSATGKTEHPFRSTSDIDLLVEFNDVPSELSGWNHALFYLYELLRPIADRRVHVTENASFHRAEMQEELLRIRELIYDESPRTARAPSPGP